MAELIMAGASSLLVLLIGLFFSWFKRFVDDSRKSLNSCADSIKEQTKSYRDCREGMLVSLETRPTRSEVDKRFAEHDRRLDEQGRDIAEVKAVLYQGGRR